MTFAVVNATDAVEATRTPKRTESVRMDDILSPFTSGMSLKKAMTTEKRHMNALTNTSEKGSMGSLEDGEGTSSVS